jgi:hypothetical protein
MKSPHRNKCASKLQSLEEAPEFLRETLRGALKPDEEIRLLIFGPAVEIPDKTSPATLLAVLDGGWIIASSTDGIPPCVVRVSFGDTLLVELMLVLLYGRLKLDYTTASGATCFAAIYFNTTTEPLYKEAVRHLLSGIEGSANGAPMADGRLNVLLQGVPLELCSAAHEFRPFSQRVLAVRNWPAVMGRRMGWLQHELAPQGLLMLTEREFILISEEKNWTWLRVNQPNKYGNIATYCPLSRLQSWRIEAADGLAALKVNLHNGRGGEIVQAEFPRHAKPGLEDFMGCAMEQREIAGLEKESLI